MPNIGPLEIGIVLLIVLLIFGPKRLPGLGRSLGAGMREFKDSITGKGGDAEAEADKGELDAPAADAGAGDAPADAPAERAAKS
ncbi:MAG: twin-arginine translocase TatA/TatE family subunit [Thermoleophilaceae bacterium]